MKKFFTNTEANYFKNILIDNNEIYVSEKDFGEETFLGKFNNTKKGFVESRLKISVANITEFILNEKDYIIVLNFPEIDDETSAILEFKTKEEYDEVKEYLIANTQFTGAKKLIGNMSWIKNAIYTIVSAILTGVFYMASKNHEEVTIRGGRKGLKKIIVFLVDLVGETGVLIIGGIITLGLAYWTYTKFREKGTEIEVYK